MFLENQSATIKRKYKKFIETDRSMRSLLIWRTLVKYVRDAMIKSLAVIVGPPLLTICRLVGPLVVVRVGFLMHRMNMLKDAEIWLRSESLRTAKKSEVNLFLSGTACNRQALTMIKPRMTVWEMNGYLLNFSLKIKKCWKTSPAGCPPGPYPAYLSGMVSHRRRPGRPSCAEKPEKP